MGIFDLIESAKGLVGLGNYSYSALPEHQSRREQRQRRMMLVEKYRRALKLTMVGMIVFAVISVLFISSTRSNDDNSTQGTSCDSVDKGFQCSTNISHFWGQYSPYFSVPSEISPDIPQGCSVTFAQVLSRHGARDPTKSKSEAYAALITKIQASASSYAPGFGFLENFHYTLGQDQLTVFGEQELHNSGIKFYQRYQTIASSSATPPFFRAGAQTRVAQSAERFAEGFHATKAADPNAESDKAFFPYDILLVSEQDGMNNTLSHGLCTNFEQGAVSEIGAKAKAEWADIFLPPIQARMNEGLPDVNLTADETIFLMDLCPFTTVSDDGEGGGVVTTTTTTTTTSTKEEEEAAVVMEGFCHLFTEDEWASYGYYQSLDKWYGYGRGNPLGPTQGVGFVNELVARLMGEKVEDSTSTNTTLDDDEESFPLGRKLYADFSHDNDMMSIFAALGLFSATEDLSRTERQGRVQTEGFSAGVSVPFAARVYVEKLSCEDDDEQGGQGEQGEMVRVLLNDRVMPLKGCGSDELGRCSLMDFVDSMAFAKGGGLWDSCFT